MPGQQEPTVEVSWRAVRVQGQDALAVRAARKLVQDELLLTRIASPVLRLYLDRVPLTESLKRLLVDAVQRVAGQGGDPVVQLQTNFGGGKTHSILALFHLFSGVAPSELAGVDGVLAEAGVKELPEVRRVVLVGNKISPGNPVTKPDGTVVRTLWGELAYQLGGRPAYARIAKDDENATSPGDVLRELFVEHGPCLVLVDEWVAYARQLHDQSDLPAGSFETQFTFAQALTEAAKAAKSILVVTRPTRRPTTWRWWSRRPGCRRRRRPTGGS